MCETEQWIPCSPQQLADCEADPPPGASPGVISVHNPAVLDFEVSPRLRLVLQAESAASFGFLAVQVNLQDENDNQPRFQLQNYVAFIREAQGYDLPVIQVAWGGG